MNFRTYFFLINTFLHLIKHIVKIVVNYFFIDIFVKIFRTNNKQLLVKIFNANKNDLYNVVKKYLPQNKFNDRYLVKKMVEIDTDTISLIGEKLKNNKKFMKEIWK